MFAKLLTTALPPPRQDETDHDGVLPPAANRRAEALHQMLTVYGSDPKAPKRHGQTCTLNLTVDAETLAGKDTGRVPTLEGKPVAIAKARLLACEAEVIPSVFDYSTGEAIELGRALRLPNTALRRKLELEQAGGCAWTGCGRPVQWTEAHHITHWANSGKTTAENLILLCRFHHGRIHTNGWSITKTGPGKALITHHDHHQDPGPGETDPDQQCGCTDYRTPEDLDLEFQGDVANVFPTGLYPEEWSETLKPDLEAAAEHAERQQLEADINAAKARARARFTTPTPVPEPASGPPPRLSRPPRDARGGGRSTIEALNPETHRDRALPHTHTQNHHTPALRGTNHRPPHPGTGTGTQPRDERHPTTVPTTTPTPTGHPGTLTPVHRCPLEPQPKTTPRAIRGPYPCGVDTVLLTQRQES